MSISIQIFLAILSNIIATAALVWAIVSNYSKNINHRIEKMEKRINDKIFGIRQDIIRIDDRMYQHVVDHNKGVSHVGEQNGNRGSTE